MIFYPPDQIPTATLFDLIGAGVIFNQRGKFSKSQIPSLLIAAAVAVLLIGAVLAFFYSSFRDVIQINDNDLAIFETAFKIKEEVEKNEENVKTVNKGLKRRRHTKQGTKYSYL